MKKSFYCFLIIVCCLFSFFVLSCKEPSRTSRVDDFSYSYNSIQIGETGLSIEAKITLLTHRIDMLQPEYERKSWAEYIDDFNKIYPGIKVQVESVTDYARTAKYYIGRTDIMMIPPMDKKLYEKFFLPIGSVKSLSSVVRFLNNTTYAGTVYGIPSAGNARGVLYNKRIFSEAGVSEIPKTPEEFMDALRLIKKNTASIPLYTNYASDWAIGSWDEYLGGSSSGDANFLYRYLPHEKNPFSDPHNGTGPYYVYKILYDAAREGLIEDNYKMSDWEASKGMLNRGDIATMFLGSWAYAQVQGRGNTPEDVGYMPFPVTVNGKQYASSGADYAFGISNDIKEENKEAALIFVKWMVENSGFAYIEGEIPTSYWDENLPELYKSFIGVDFVEDALPIPGEEYIMDVLNADSALNFCNNGYEKVRDIVDHAKANDKSYDEIMNEWNEIWSNAQVKNKINH